MVERTLTPPEEATELLSDHTDMDRNPLRIGSSERSGIRVELSDDAYFEYVWRDSAGRLLRDPDNPDSNRSIWYGQVSVIRAPGYRPHPVAVASSELARPQGELRRERFHSEALGELRRVNSYSPNGLAQQSLPTILVQDGTAFNRLGLLPQMVDILSSRGLQPVRLVLLEPVDRNREYTFSAAYRDFIFAELLPALPELAGEPTDLYLLGASLGGLASATLALEQPDMFRGVASLSGAFLGGPDDPDPYESSSEWVLRQVSGGRRLPSRWFIGTGTIEWLHQPNRRLAETLQGRDVSVRYEERSAGHNWPNWRDLIPAALTHLLES